jgi:hypothetical protein
MLFSPLLHAGAGVRTGSTCLKTIAQGRTKREELDLDRMSVWLMNHDLSIASLFLRAAHVSGTFYADLPLPERGDKSPLKSEIFLICERSLSYRQHWLV